MADTIVSTDTAAAELPIQTALEPTTALAAAEAPTATSALETTDPLATSTARAGSKARQDKKDKPDTENEAIVHCMKAWNYTYKKEAAKLAEGESDWPAEKAANQAYLRETPPLVGYKNICDFIACINFASMTGIVTRREAAHYLANARVALAALSLQPKPQATGAKSGGKSPTDPPEGEEE